MKHYIAEKWRDILIFNQLDTREKIWSLEAEWFEEPNQRRGGWSGVSRIELNLPLGGKVGVFLKRQENHVSKSLLHPISGFSTFVREFEQIKAFHEHYIPSLDLIFFEEWKDGRDQRAVLMTEELADYIPLSSDEYQPKGVFASTKKQKAVLFKKLAELMRAMHKNGFQHNCFYPKHIFAKQLGNDDIDLRVIDLEKVKTPLIKNQAAFRDLYTLYRHSENWGVKDKVRFYKQYQSEKKLSDSSKKLWVNIANKITRKSKLYVSQINDRSGSTN